MHEAIKQQTVSNDGEDLLEGIIDGWLCRKLVIDNRTVKFGRE